MTEQTYFPPLRALPPGHHELRRQHLLGEITRESDSERPSWASVPSFRLRFVGLALAVIAAAVCAVVFTGALGGSGTPGATTSMSPGLVPMTISHPLGFAKQTTLSDAQSLLGAPVVLPDTSLVQPSDASPVVWVSGFRDDQGTATSGGTLAVTFPSQGVIVEYTRPVPYHDPLTAYQGLAAELPAAQVVTLDGVPALAIKQNSDDTGANFGSVDVVVGASQVRVFGHYDDATLDSLARSILRQSHG